MIANLVKRKIEKMYVKSKENTYENENDSLYFWADESNHYWP